MENKSIDELNAMSGQKSKVKSENKNKSSDGFDYVDFINHYFDVMKVPKRQKEKRIDASKELFNVILFFLVWCDKVSKPLDNKTLRMFENRYREVVFQYGESDEYFDKYIPFIVNEIVDTTFKHKRDEYYTSVKRAASIAVNEANSVINHAELIDAIELGYKYKIWNTEQDNSVRETHKDLQGVSIPIKDHFIVGVYEMDMPHDTTYGAGAEEISNCRCWLTYR